MKISLSRIQEYIQKNSLIIGLNLSFAFILILVVNVLWNGYRVRNKVDAPDIGSFETHNGPVQVIANIPPPTLQQELNAYASVVQKSAQEQAREWAQQLALTPHPQAPENLFLNAQTEETLSYTAQTDLIDYSNFRLLDPLTMPTLSQAQAEVVLTAFLQRLSISLETVSIESAEGQILVKEDFEDSFEPAQEQPPTAYRFEVIQNIDGVPFIPDATATSSWSFLVISNGVIQAQLHGSEIEVKNPKAYTPLKFTDVLKNVQSGNFQIVGTLLRFSPSNTIQRLTLEEVSLEYRRDPNSGTVLPMWRFDGTATLKSGNIETISLVTSALPTRPAQP